MVYKNSSVILAAVLLTGCGTPTPRNQTPHGAPPVPGTAPIGKPPDGPGAYSIDPAQSELRVLVFRAGPMARLGHNHVLVNRFVGGWIKFSGNPAAASFALEVPVSDFLVDNAGARSQEGSDFFEEVPEDAKVGTQQNMLSPALLDAVRYPTITLTSVAVGQTSGVTTATVVANVAGHESTLTVPFQLATSTGQITASGSLKLRQTALGLTPFSIMLGALQVQDEIVVRFTLVALVT